MRRLLNIFNKIRAQTDPPKDEIVLKELSDYHEKFLNAHYETLKTKPENKSAWVQKSKNFGFAHTFKQLMNDEQKEETIMHFNNIFYKENQNEMETNT